MERSLVFIDTFSSVFNDTTYYISQFVDDLTLSIIRFSTTDEILSSRFVTGEKYNCILGIKKNKLFIEEVSF